MRYVNPSTRNGGVEQIVVADRAGSPGTKISTGLEDAPYDDVLYGRLNGDWEPVPPGGGGGGGGPIARSRFRATAFNFTGGIVNPTDYVLDNGDGDVSLPGIAVVHDPGNNAFHPVDEGWYSFELEFTVGFSGGTAPTAVELHTGSGYYNRPTMVYPVVTSGLHTFPSVIVWENTHPEWLPAYGAGGDPSYYIGFDCQTDGSGSTAHTPDNNAVDPRVYLTVTKWRGP